MPMSNGSAPEPALCALDAAGPQAQALDAHPLYAQLPATAEKIAALSRYPYDYWQAGKSVGGIDTLLPAAEIVRSFDAALH